MACSRLETMLHLDIQKGKEDMKSLDFHKYIRGATACTKRLAMDNKRCDQTDIKLHILWLYLVQWSENG